jgi:hypothetical protein
MVTDLIRRQVAVIVATGGGPVGKGRDRDDAIDVAGGASILLGPIGVIGAPSLGVELPRCWERAPSTTSDSAMAACPR